MRRISGVLLCTMFLQGCTSYYSVDRSRSSEFVAEINGRAGSNSVIIEAGNGKSYMGENIAFSPDSLFWYDAPLDRSFTYPTSDINRLTIINRREGMGRGFAVGALIGIGVLLLAGILGSDLIDIEYGSEGSKVDVGEYIVGAIIIGGGIGIPVGGGMGVKYTYTFTDPAGQTGPGSH